MVVIIIIVILILVSLLIPAPCCSAFAAQAQAAGGAESTGSEDRAWRKAPFKNQDEPGRLGRGSRGFERCSVWETFKFTIIPKLAQHPEMPPVLVGLCMHQLEYCGSWLSQPRRPIVKLLCQFKPAKFGAMCRCSRPAFLLHLEPLFGNQRLTTNIEPCGKFAQQPSHQTVSQKKEHMPLNSNTLKPICCPIGLAPAEQPPAPGGPCAPLLR